MYRKLANGLTCPEYLSLTIPIAPPQVLCAQRYNFFFLQCSVASGKVIPEYKLYGHRQVGAASSETECPGDNVYRIIKTWDHWVSLHWGNKSTRQPV